MTSVVTTAAPPCAPLHHIFSLSFSYTILSYTPIPTVIHPHPPSPTITHPHHSFADGLKVTRCLHLPPGDHSVTAHCANRTHSDNGLGHESVPGSGSGSGLGSGSGCLYVSTGARVYFIEGVSGRKGPDVSPTLVPGNGEEHRMHRMDRMGSSESRLDHLRAMGEKELELFNSSSDVSRRVSSGTTSTPCSDVSRARRAVKSRCVHHAAGPLECHALTPLSSADSSHPAFLLSWYCIVLILQLLVNTIFLFPLLHLVQAL